MSSTQKFTNKRSYISKQTPKGSKPKGGSRSQFMANVSDFKCNSNSSGGSGRIVNITTSYKGSKISMIPSIKGGKIVVSMMITYGSITYKNKQDFTYPLEEVLKDNCQWVDKSSQQEQPQEEEEEESGEDSKESH